MKIYELFENSSDGATSAGNVACVASSIFTPIISRTMVDVSTQPKIKKKKRARMSPSSL